MRFGEAFNKLKDSKKNVLEKILLKGLDRITDEEINEQLVMPAHDNIRGENYYQKYINQINKNNEYNNVIKNAKNALVGHAQSI